MRTGELGFRIAWWWWDDIRFEFFSKGNSISLVILFPWNWQKGLKKIYIDKGGYYVSKSNK